MLGSGGVPLRRSSWYWLIWAMPILGPGFGGVEEMGDGPAEEVLPCEGSPACRACGGGWSWGDRRPATPTFRAGRQAGPEPAPVGAAAGGETPSMVEGEETAGTDQHGDCSVVSVAAVGGVQGNGRERLSIY